MSLKIFGSNISTVQELENKLSDINEKVTALNSEKTQNEGTLNRLRQDRDDAAVEAMAGSDDTAEKRKLQLSDRINKISARIGQINDDLRTAELLQIKLQGDLAAAKDQIKLDAYDEKAKKIAENMDDIEEVLRRLGTVLKETFEICDSLSLLSAGTSGQPTVTQTVRDCVARAGALHIDGPSPIFPRKTDWNYESVKQAGSLRALVEARMPGYRAAVTRA